MTGLRCNSCYNEITHVISLNRLFVTNPKFLKDINKRAVLKKNEHFNTTCRRTFN